MDLGGLPESEEKVGQGEGGCLCKQVIEFPISPLPLNYLYPLSQVLLLSVKCVSFIKMKGHDQICPPRSLPDGPGSGSQTLESKLYSASESPGELVKTQIAAPPAPQFLIQ